MKDRVVKLGVVITIGYGIVNTIIYWSLYFLAKTFDDTKQPLSELKQDIWGILWNVNKYLVWLYVLALGLVILTGLGRRVERR